MTIANESTMRRIAIVLASLPEPVAQRLLGSLQSDSQRSVREALRSLSDVDPLEHRRALDGFANSLRKDKTQGSKNDDAAEIVFSRAAVRNLNSTSQEFGSNTNDQRSNPDGASAPTSGTGKPAAPLAFLLDVDDDAMVEHLSGEMPQTLAIILASISPAQAARVLPRLDITMRTEAMRRMANLKELPSELIEDIGNQLRRRLVPDRGTLGGTTGGTMRGTTGAGRVALDAILAEMPHANPTRESQHRPSSVETVGRNVDTTNSLPARNESSVVNQPAVKLAEGSWPEKTQSAPRLAASRQEDSSEERREPSPLDSTDAIHSYLLSLPIDRLRDALGAVAIRTALLTLCGLPNTKAEAVLASLPRRQAKQVRDQLGQLGTLELREIDAAKEVVAQRVLNDQVEPGTLRITAVAA